MNEIGGSLCLKKNSHKQVTHSSVAPEGVVKHDVTRKKAQLKLYFFYNLTPKNTPSSIICSWLLNSTEHCF